MGYGLPIVSTNVGGIPKIVRNNENGYCCEAGDTPAMVDGVIKLLSSEDILKNMSKCSFGIVENGYSLDAHIKLVEEVYNTQLYRR